MKQPVEKHQEVTNFGTVQIDCTNYVDVHPEAKKVQTVQHYARIAMQTVDVKLTLPEERHELQVRPAVGRVFGLLFDVVDHKNSLKIVVLRSTLIGHILNLKS